VTEASSPDIVDKLSVTGYLTGSRSMKILFVNHTGIVSGAERVLLTILDHLDRERFEPTVSCPLGSDLANLVRERNVPVVATPDLQARFTWNPIRMVQYFRSYLDAIREFRRAPFLKAATLIHANSVRAGLVASFATTGTGMPVIWHLHDMMKPHPFSTTIRWVALFAPTVSVLAVSHAAAKQFRGSLLRFTGNRPFIQVLHNSIDSERFRPDPAGRRSVRQALGLTDAQFTAAIVGQLTPRKGQLETIEAMSDVVKNVPGAVLLVVGAPLFNDDQRYLARLQSAVAQLGLRGKVFFLGQRSDINALLAATDAVVINSHREPFGLIVLEALAAVKPVVAAAVDGVVEVVEDGVTGLLVPPGNRKALASALIRLAGDRQLRESLAVCGRAAIEKNFTCERYIQSLEAFYDRTALRPRP
jgi:glycosyltransferase involved in cell wall biosynthesis